MMAVVWAKLKYRSYWPAKVVEPPPALLEKFRGTKNVLFSLDLKISKYINIESKMACLSDDKLFLIFQRFC